ncbi:uncharacterized protein LOC133815048 [Humulus lupulus]|uniref:uncharacterized protein LOC133815048 n=1 Tax=Humulus lupulus TaxID=3486 RepID=UPI002B40BEC1|nr:uncharacterized protein LOC133815048 [Humulus lupulus]
MAYLSKIKDLLAQIKRYTIQQIPRKQNATTDELARLANSVVVDKANLVFIEYLDRSSINLLEPILQIDNTPFWMTPIASYLDHRILLNSHNESRKLIRKAARYLILDGVKYRRGFSMPLLRCVNQTESRRLFEEVDEGFCGNHAEGQSLSKKILGQGYFWTTMNEDSISHVRKCDNCLVYPTKIVSDNGIQFDSQLFIDFCTRHGITKSFSAVSHPQANGQVEAVNKTLKDTLKKHLEEAKKNWPERLPEVLWSYKTTERTTTGDTPFALIYGCEAMMPVEVTPQSHRRTAYDQDGNHKLLAESLDQIEERRKKSNIRLAAHQQKFAQYFNSRDKERKFDIGDLVLRRIFPEN